MTGQAYSKGLYEIEYELGGHSCFQLCWWFFKIFCDCEQFHLKLFGIRWLNMILFALLRCPSVLFLVLNTRPHAYY